MVRRKIVKKCRRGSLGIIKVHRGFEGRGGWGYNEVEMSSGKIIHLRQKPQEMWRVGDCVPKTKVKRLIDRR